MDFSSAKSVGSGALRLCGLKSSHKNRKGDVRMKSRIHHRLQSAKKYMFFLI